MTQNEYEQKKRECWDALWDERTTLPISHEPLSQEEIFNYAFDRAFALGKQENTEKSDVRKAKIRTTGKIIDVVKCTDYNNGMVYFLDNNDRDADPYDYRDLDFTYNEQDKQTEAIMREDVEKAAEEYAEKAMEHVYSGEWDSEYVQGLIEAAWYDGYTALRKQGASIGTINGDVVINL